MFGLTTEYLTDRTTTYSCELTVRPGDIVLITGPSGAGKTVLMNELQQAIPAEDRISLDQIALPNDCSVIDCIDANVVRSIRLLATAGLNDVFALLNQPTNLSEGQQYRFRLAVTLSLARPFVFADEFSSGLDRITAATIAHKIRKFATKQGTTFFLAASQNDFALDLSPDILVRTELCGDTHVTYRDLNRRTSKCRRRLASSQPN
jgi:ABC-type ATPase with predicted acetyltransferase domain